MKISIITVVFNNEKYIEDAILSVRNQDYSNIEYIIVDGGSTDNTLNIINNNLESIDKFISERDSGLYDAMNKGIQMATGEVIGILNSDDYFFNNHVLTDIILFFKNYFVDAVIGDIVFIRSNNPSHTIRKYSSKWWKPSFFTWGLMPPHPSFFVKRECFQRFGTYKTDYKIAADYELLVRFFIVNQIKFKYCPITTTKMRMGGISTNYFRNWRLTNVEILRACKENGIRTYRIKIYFRYIFKIFGFLLSS